MPISIQSVAVTTSESIATTANKLSITVAATATSISAANANRKGFNIENKTGQTIFVGTANTVSASNYWFSIPDGTFYEMPRPIYTGAIFGIVASGTAAPQITEFV
ncbi:MULTISPECIES: hypothetical protein [unclassified Nodularia (in: cyanobacteria)]|uniref:hypothetical protein n=1 Tax=unclassified Nodularia (in: cyanobacteria) TaxID=2656917 RepID=UPI001882E278|nr:MULTISPECIES: hypothetical protein [unclassified Nodularia (in: cyanobacteria)]MBE9199087.1 hypothetical protein [Nodularia sp. LEGE 06071]MCC2695774.1 hypothetical protein [Nodularia sp. LEGE 04288]